MKTLLPTVDFEVDNGNLYYTLDPGRCILV